MRLRISSSSKVHFSEGNLASVPVNVTVNLVFSCAHLPSALLLLRQRLRKNRFAAGSGLGTGLGTTISNVQKCSSKATTPVRFSRPQLTHVLRGEIAAIPSLPLFQTIIIFVFADAVSTIQDKARQFS